MGGEASEEEHVAGLTALITGLACILVAAAAPGPPPTHTTVHVLCWVGAVLHQRPCYPQKWGLTLLQGDEVSQAPDQEGGKEGRREKEKEVIQYIIIIIIRIHCYVNPLHHSSVLLHHSTMYPSV